MNHQHHQDTQPATTSRPRTLEQLRDSYQAWRDRREARYHTPAEPLPYISPPEPPVMQYAEAREAFWTCYQTLLKMQYPTVLQDNVDLLREIIRYHIADEEGRLDRAKGLYVFGEYGSGKSQLMRSLVMLSATYPHHRLHRPVWIHYKTFKKRTATGIQLESVLAEWSGYDLIIDDLGYEEDDRTTRTNDYGTITNIVQEIVRARYELYIRRGILTHFTSNKPLSEIDELYGAGTSTRLSEMCSPVLWRGGSLRK